MKYIIGNITQAYEECIAHGCNAQGRMGSGVALAIKNTFPEAYEEYRKAYESHHLYLGMIIWAASKKKLIANCVTQKNYGNDGKQYVDYDLITKCMKDLNYYSKVFGYTTVAMPKIGAGLGGGDWEKISKIIEAELTDVSVSIYVLKEEEIPHDRNDNYQQPDIQ